MYSLKSAVKVADVYNSFSHSRSWAWHSVRPSIAVEWFRCTRFSMHRRVQASFFKYGGKPLTTNKSETEAKFSCCRSHIRLKLLPDLFISSFFRRKKLISLQRKWKGGEKEPPLHSGKRQVVSEAAAASAALRRFHWLRMADSSRITGQAEPELKKAGKRKRESVCVCVCTSMRVSVCASVSVCVCMHVRGREK